MISVRRLHVTSAGTRTLEAYCSSLLGRQPCRIGAAIRSPPLAMVRSPSPSLESLPIASELELTWPAVSKKRGPDRSEQASDWTSGRALLDKVRDQVPNQQSWLSSAGAARRSHLLALPLGRHRARHGLGNKDGADAIRSSPVSRPAVTNKTPAHHTHFWRGLDARLAMEIF